MVSPTYFDETELIDEPELAYSPYVVFHPSELELGETTRRMNCAAEAAIALSAAEARELVESFQPQLTTVIASPVGLDRHARLAIKEGRVDGKAFDARADRR